MKYYNNENVRRKDRLLSKETAEELITNGEFCILSMLESRVNGLGGYGIPVNFVWDGNEYIYIHCAPEGHKLDCCDSNRAVSLCIVGHTKVIPNKFTTAYQSVVIRGNIDRNLQETERFKALELILKKYSPEDMVVGLKYAEKSFHRTEILRFKINSISGKSKEISY